jgi:hypothetical protein
MKPEKMMKQLTVYCSEELTGKVNLVLHNREIDGYIHMPGIYGNKLKTRGSFEKDLIYPASAFVVFSDDDKIAKVMADLRAYTDQCDVEPCLRMIVTHAEQIL